jgi:hypothetical protein
MRALAKAFWMLSRRLDASATLSGAWEPIGAGVDTGFGLIGTSACCGAGAGAGAGEGVLGALTTSDMAHPGRGKRRFELDEP